MVTRWAVVAVLTLRMLQSGVAAASARGDTDELEAGLLRLAQIFLEKSGSVEVFGGGVRADGTLVSLAIDPYWQASAEEQVEAMIRYLDGGGYTAGCVVVDTRVVLPGQTTKSDALGFIVATRGGRGRGVLRPYKIDQGKVKWSPPIVQDGANQIFSGRGSAGAPGVDKIMALPMRVVAGPRPRQR